MKQKMKEVWKMTEETPKLKCPQCKARLSYLAVRSMFYVGRQDGLPHYTNNQNDFRCPFCNGGIAGSEELAIERLKTGRFGYTTKQFEKMIKKGRKCLDAQMKQATTPTKPST